MNKRKIVPSLYHGCLIVVGNLSLSGSRTITVLLLPCLVCGHDSLPLGQAFFQCLHVVPNLKRVIPIIEIVAFEPMRIGRNCKRDHKGKSYGK